MLRKNKSKTNSITCEELMKEFDVLHNIEGVNEYKNIKDTYYKLKEFYKKKIKHKEIETQIEKIRLEKKLGRYEGKVIQFNSAFVCAFCSSILIVIIQVMLQIYNNKNSALIGELFTLFTLLILFIYIIYDFTKDSTKQKPKDLIIFISLKVLDDIEKEMQQQEIKDKAEADKKDKHELIQQCLSNKDKINMRTINNTLDIVADVTKVISSRRKSK